LIVYGTVVLDIAFAVLVTFKIILQNHEWPIGAFLDGEYYSGLVLTTQAQLDHRTVSGVT